jgi:phosphoribosylformylglycinamidine synthase
VELGVFSVMWSEHCSYKSSRRHLRKFPTTGPRVVHGPGENAGVVDIGDGQVAVFKMESHNHPSFIEPYQGAATGVGGIMRDVFTMGARPIALLNALRFGDPGTPDAPAGGGRGLGDRRLRQLRGRAHRRRRDAVPPGYNGNILVNAMCVGLADATRSSSRPPRRRTCRWSISAPRRAATASTAPPWPPPSSTTLRRRSGPPSRWATLRREALIEATLELMATGAVAAIQDMGAAGLTSSSVEMAGKGELGDRTRTSTRCPSANGHERL